MSTLKRVDSAMVVAVCTAVMFAIPARAQLTSVPANKCLGGKINAVGKALAARTNCHSKEAGSGTVDPSCLQKQSDKFTGGAEPDKGAFNKLEAKYPPTKPVPCLTFGDQAAFQATVGGYAAAVVTATGSAVGKCDAKKIKCVGKYVKAFTKCVAKAARKTGLVDSACTAKASAKLADGSKGCLDAAEAHADCTNVGSQVVALQQAADTFVRESVCSLAPGYAGCATATATPSVTPDDTVTATPTDVASATPTDTATLEPTVTHTYTLTSTPTEIPTQTATNTTTPTATNTTTPTATNTPTPTATPECSVPSDCPATENECIVSSCIDGQCVTVDNDGGSCACGGTCADGVCVAAQVRDGFQRSSLRGEIWSTDTAIPAGAASAVQSSGAMVLTNGAFLVSQSQFDPATTPFHLTGDWTFTTPGSDGDTLQVLTRSTGTPSATDGEATGGIECNVSTATDQLVIVARGSAFTDFAAGSPQPVSIAAGETFFFEMIDDGTNVTCALINNSTGAKATATASSVIHPSTNYVVFHNRPRTTDTHVATVDHVLIEPTSLRPMYGWRFNPIAGVPMPRDWVNATSNVATIGAVGTGVTAVEGHDGPAIQPDGTLANGWVKLDKASGNPGKGNFFASFWYKAPNTSSFAFRPLLLTKNQRSSTPLDNGWFNFYLTGSPAPVGVFAEVRGPNNEGFIQLLKKDIPNYDDLAWHHWAIYRCVNCSGGATPNSCLTTYYDGVPFSGPVCNSTSIGDLETKVNPAAPTVDPTVWVGSALTPSPPGPAFTEGNGGSFEDIRFFHTALTPAQILNLAACR